MIPKNETLEKSCSKKENMYIGADIRNIDTPGVETK
jgi:hypothetical protein